MARRKLHSVGVVITAGGRGTRFGGSTPKQFQLLNRMPILLHSINAFESLNSISEIVVVVPDDQIRQTERLLRKWKPKKISHIVVGGNERQHSVRNGLLSFDAEPDLVLVHDAVRPLVSKETITRVIEASAKYGAAVVGVRVKDTIKLEEDGFFKKTLDRTKVWVVQTPQGFRFDILKKAHNAAQRAAFLGTDESSLVERLKIPVRIVEGDYRNIKITTEDDLRLAEMLVDSKP